MENKRFLRLQNREQLQTLIQQEGVSPYTIVFLEEDRIIYNNGHEYGGTDESYYNQIYDNLLEKLNGLLPSDVIPGSDTGDHGDNSGSGNDPIDNPGEDNTGGGSGDPIDDNQNQGDNTGGGTGEGGDNTGDGDDGLDDPNTGGNDPNDPIDNPGGDNPGGGGTGGEDPIDDEDVISTFPITLTGDNTGGDNEPGGDQPGGDQPGGDEPGGDQQEDIISTFPITLTGDNTGGDNGNDPIENQEEEDRERELREQEALKKWGFPIRFLVDNKYPTNSLEKFYQTLLELINKKADKTQFVVLSENEYQEKVIAGVIDNDVFYFTYKVDEEPETPDTPDNPDVPDTPEIPEALSKWGFPIRFTQDVQKFGWKLPFGFSIDITQDLKFPIILTGDSQHTTNNWQFGNILPIILC